MTRKFLFVSILFSLIALVACNKSEQLKINNINDFAPLVIGKYITYQLDSLRFANNITAYDAVISYQIKQIVMDTLTDNLGRKGFSIRRYIRNSASDQWAPDNTFFAINTGRGYEFVENNFRYLKLTEPIKNGYSWKGNTFIDTQSAYSLVQYLDDWNYTYDSLNKPMHLGNFVLDSTLIVREKNDTIGFVSDSTFSEINFSVSNYGKGIGLVYHKFLHREYQAPPPPYHLGDYGYKIGYGVTLTMIDHN